MPDSIYVSVDWERGDDTYKRLLMKWDRDRQFKFDDTSKLSPRKKLKPKILAASTLLCIVGAKTNACDQVAWEVQTAARAGKKLVGVKIHHSFPTPQSLHRFRAAWAESFTIEAIKAALDA